VADQELDLAVVTFDRIAGAEHTYADVLDTTGQAPWTREISFAVSGTPWRLRHRVPSREPSGRCRTWPSRFPSAGWWEPVQTWLTADRLGPR
jgi:hypothetical protein